MFARCRNGPTTSHVGDAHHSHDVVADKFTSLSDLMTFGIQLFKGTRVACWLVPSHAGASTSPSGTACAIG